MIKKVCLIYILLFCFLISLLQCALFFNDEELNPVIRQIEDGLPVFYIHPAPVSGEYSPVSIFYLGKEYKAEARIRGGVSRNFPMKSYTLNFSGNTLFNDSGAQFKNKRKIVLIAPFDDNSCIRQRLAYDLWNRMDPDHIQIKTYHAVVYMQCRYHGLYTVAEHIDGDFIAENGLYRDGDLFKGVNHKANFYLKKNLHEGFEKKEGHPEEGEPGAYTSLEGLVEFTGGAAPEDFLNRVDQILDRKEYEDWWIYTTFMLASDSCGKNSYHYYDQKRGVWRYIPWDFNYSFGQDWKTCRTCPTAKPTYADLNKIFERFLKQEEICGAIEDRYADLLAPGNVCDINWILSTIDDYDQEIRVAAVKNEQKWRREYEQFSYWKNREDFTNYEEEISYIKDWVCERHEFLTEEYDK